MVKLALVAIMTRAFQVKFTNDHAVNIKNAVSNGLSNVKRIKL